MQGIVSSRLLNDMYEPLFIYFISSRYLYSRAELLIDLVVRHYLFK